MNSGASKKVKIVAGNVLLLGLLVLAGIWLRGQLKNMGGVHPCEPRSFVTGKVPEECQKKP